VARSQRNDLLAPGSEESVCADHQRSGSYPAQGGKRGIDFGASSCAQDMDLQAHSAGRLLHFGHPELKIFNVRVQQDADQGGLWSQLAQQSQPLRIERAGLRRPPDADRPGTVRPGAGDTCEAQTSRQMCRVSLPLDQKRKVQPTTISIGSKLSSNNPAPPPAFSATASRALVERRELERADVAANLPTQNRRLRTRNPAGILWRATILVVVRLGNVRTAIQRRAARRGSMGRRKAAVVRQRPQLRRCRRNVRALDRSA